MCVCVSIHAHTHIRNQKKNYIYFLVSMHIQWLQLQVVNYKL